MADTYFVPFTIFLIGGLVVLTVVLRVWLARFGIPGLVSALLLGLLLSAADKNFDFISARGDTIFELLANIGLICLLFRVGLESNLHELIGKLPRAIPIWLGNVVLSGTLAYFVCQHVFGLGLIPSLFVGIAFTATSIAVSVAVWREEGHLNGPDGETLLDVAELDDVSAIVLMALLIAIAGELRNDHSHVFSIMLATGAEFLIKFVVIAVFCLLFAKYIERTIAGYLRRLQRPDSALSVFGISIMIAALVDLLGFSLAVGALFAGLVFSRDPDVVRTETLFMPIHDFFVPFFFLGVGLKIDPSSLGEASALGAVLFVVAVLGKFLGAGLPALASTSLAGAAVIGASMVPRAEIAMVIAEEGRRLGDWALPPEAYAAISLTSVLTCVVIPPVVRVMLRRWPPNRDEQD